MDSQKCIRARIICDLCPLTVADIHIIACPHHNDVITSVLQFLLQLQRYRQIQFIFIYPAGGSSCSGSYLGLHFIRARRNRFLLIISFQLVPCIDDNQFTLSICNGLLPVIRLFLLGYFLFFHDHPGIVAA